MAIFAVTINLLWMSVSPSFGPYHLLLVASYATLYPALSVHPSIGASIGPSITLYFFGVHGFFGHTAPAQMPH